MSSPAAIDLDAYFARIGYAGPTAATLETLHAIVAHHATAIPFENLDVLLGRPIQLDPARLQQKLILDRRGGYCFEQNTLLLLVLGALGFQVTPLPARVRLQQPREVLPPRTHLCLRVDLAGEAWLADVGIGGLSLAAAVRLDRSDEQPTPHEPRRILREGARFFHQAKLEDGWSDVYEFTHDVMHPIDCELANWWTSTSPASKFRQNLTVALAGPAGIRRSIRNRDFTIRRGPEILARRELMTPAELLEVLAQHFALNFPAGTRFGPPGSPWPA